MFPMVGGDPPSFWVMRSQQTTTLGCIKGPPSLDVHCPATEQSCQIHSQPARPSSPQQTAWICESSPRPHSAAGLHTHMLRGRGGGQSGGPGFPRANTARVSRARLGRRARLPTAVELRTRSSSSRSLVFQALLPSGRNDISALLCHSNLLQINHRWCVIGHRIYAEITGAPLSGYIWKKSQKRSKTSGAEEWPI